MTTPRRPAVFIHGLWLHATSWEPWLDLFRDAGYDPIAPGWPNEPATVEEARKEPDRVANIGIAEITAHFHKIIDSLDASPVIVGLPPAQIRAAMPALGNPANRRKAVSLTRKQFRFGFGNALTQEESDALFDKWAIPSPARTLFQAASANFVPHSQAKVNTDNSTRGPLLLISGTADHTVPDVVTRSTLKQYRRSSAVTDLRQFDGRGHSLTIDNGWKEVADAVLQWLSTNEI